VKVKQFSLDLIAAFILLSFFLLSSIQIASLKPVVFFFQDISGVYEGADFGFKKEVIQEATEETLDYVKGANLNLPYTQREKFHLAEVRSLFLNIRKVWLVSVILTFGILLLIHLKVLQWQERIKVITKSLTIFCLVLDLGLLFLFPHFFTVFHQILFSPGTWEFAKEDLLTALFPYQFWVMQTIFVLSFSAFLSAISFFVLRLLYLLAK